MSSSPSRTHVEHGDEYTGRITWSWFLNACLYADMLYCYDVYLSAPALAPRRIDARVGAFSDGSPRRSNFPRRRPRVTRPPGRLSARFSCSQGLTSPTASALYARSSTLHPVPLLVTTPPPDALASISSPPCSTRPLKVCSALAVLVVGLLPTWHLLSAVPAHSAPTAHKRFRTSRFSHGMGMLAHQHAIPRASGACGPPRCPIPRPRDARCTSHVCKGCDMHRHRRIKRGTP